MGIRIEQAQTSEAADVAVRRPQEGAWVTLRQLLTDEQFQGLLVHAADQVVSFVHHQKSSERENSASWAFSRSSATSHSSATSASCVFFKVAGIVFHKALGVEHDPQVEMVTHLPNYHRRRPSGTRISTRLARPDSNWR
ncbi:hypothetical protein ACVBEG_27835 [Pseudomonas sp. GG8]